MPELIEVEIYRQLGEAALGRPIAEVHAPDDWFLKGTSAEEVTALCEGAVLTAARRRGKLMIFDTDTTLEPGSDGDTNVNAAAGADEPGGVLRLGLRFGMTGRLLVDDRAAIDQLEYSSDRNDPAWDRFGFTFADGGSLVMRDPRRLGGVELNPNEDALGFDADSLTLKQLREVLARTGRPLKATLLDQARIAGLGNLLVDETLWRAGLHPERASDELLDDELRSLHRFVRSTVRALSGRGGSHTGDLQSERNPGGRCPRDGAALARAEVGGRTTWFCPQHQS